MFVVIPFCTKDEHLVLKNLEWCKRLESSVPFKALVVHDNLSDATEVKQACEGYFESVDVFSYPRWTGRMDWPMPQNFQFQQCAGFIYISKREDSWFWWEADATPLKAGWLEAIQDAHKQGGKPFSGHIVGEPYGHMTGVGVYPWNLPEVSGAIMATMGVPWDVAGKREVIPLCHKINHVIQHIWERDGAPFSFKDKADAESVLSRDAVIFHRCKDGSLIDVLGGGAVDSKPKAPTPDTAVITLGRYGDICISLPISKRIFDSTGKKPAFIAAEECVDILDGVDYVEPVTFRGHYSKLMQAISQFKPKFKRMIVAQMYGNDGATRTTDSFCKDAWAQSKMLPFYGRTSLVFNRRDEKREDALCSKYLSAKPNILVNFSGHSSPFPHTAKAMADIQRRWADRCNIVDLSKIKAHRIYDLLGLMDYASVMVTSDTSTLHLAAASNIPYVALLADTPELWYGSSPLGNCQETIRYSEFSLMRERMHRVIHENTSPKHPCFYHVYPDFMGSGDSFRRNQLAAESWKVPYATGMFRPVPVHDEQLYRHWEKDGNGKKLPFLKDVVEHAYDLCPADDFILLTNTDTCFSPTIGTTLQTGLKTNPIGYARRRDFQRLDRLLSDQEIPTGTSYVGKDLFVFKPSWWAAHRNEMPDMIYGAEGWDALLAILFEESKAQCWTDLIYHERHYPSSWENPQNRYSVPSQIYCLDLAKKFCKEHGKNPADYGFK